jgi:hypothetical protein
MRSGSNISAEFARPLVPIYLVVRDGANLCFPSVAGILAAIRLFPDSATMEYALDNTDARPSKPA